MLKTCYHDTTDRLSVMLFLYHKTQKDMRIVKTAEDRKNEILDVAEELFAEKGFDNASTNDIIGRIGIARGTLYHHFSSKEDILDALVERMTHEGIARAKAIISDDNIPLLEKLTGAILALNIDSGAGAEVFEQIHKPQNALLHQKMQERLLTGVVPLITQIIEEGVCEGSFSTKYPAEAAEMIVVYSSIAFDELAELMPKEKARKIEAFICFAERILGAEEHSLESTILKIMSK